MFLGVNADVRAAPGKDSFYISFRDNPLANFVEVWLILNV
jgi:hypothetical protein